MALRRACDAADRAGGWKTFRHTFASRLAMAGVGSPTIADLMGHTDLLVTGRYMHLSPAHRRDASKKRAKWSKKSTPNRTPKQ